MGLFGTIGSLVGGSNKGGGIASIIKGIQARQQGGNLPVDNSHSHESQEGQAGASTMGAAPEPEQINRSMVNDNKFASAGAQQLGTSFWQGDQLAAQTAQQRSTPTPLPGEEYLSGGRPDQDISPLMQQQKGKTQTVQNDPKLQEGSDASYGISGYVNTEKEYKQALQEKNHPNVYNSPVKQTNYPHSSKDPVAKDHMNVYNSSTNDGEKNFLVTHSEKHGSEHINDGGVSKETKREHDSLVGVYNKRNNLKEFKLKKK